MFNGDADVDHILPRWRSLDDSLANKVVCHRRCNEEKGDRTPREWLEAASPDKYAQVLLAAETLPFNKRLKFQRESLELEEFVSRQLNDTAYISRLVSQYLKCLGATVVCPRGQMTAELRHWWGLNGILDPEKHTKNRSDHRHHAVDALVLALTDHQRLHALANARGKNMPLPWPTFAADARDQIVSIVVSHRARRRIEGAVHEATFYGPTQKQPAKERLGSDCERPWASEWIEDENQFVYRKPVAELQTLGQVRKVRDKTIRKILLDRLRDLKIDVDGGKNDSLKIPKDAFSGDHAPRMPSGVPIRRVRIVQGSETFRPVSKRRAFQYVKPGSNHHIVYRIKCTVQDEGWAAEVVTTLDAARRALAGESLVDRSDSERGAFVMSLSKNEMFEITESDGEIASCVVQKLDQSKRLYYRYHNDARPAKERRGENQYLTPEGMRRANATKIFVDPLGRVRRAND